MQQEHKLKNASNADRLRKLDIDDRLSTLSEVLMRIVDIFYLVCNKYLRMDVCNGFHFQSVSQVMFSSLP